MKNGWALTAQKRPQPLLAALLLTGAGCLSACICSRVHDAGERQHASAQAAAVSFKLDQALAKRDLAAMTKSPHVFGSPQQAEVTRYIKAALVAAGVTVQLEPFAVDVPNPLADKKSGASLGPIAVTLSRQGTNIYATDVLKPHADCAVALASHYDSKDVAGIDYLGANDSGSSSIALLQQIIALKQQAGQFKTECDVIGIWFDGEEAVLPEWNDGLRSHPAHLQDNTYGSRYAAGRLTNCTFQKIAGKCLPKDLGGEPLVALILMDMIGSPGLRFTHDSDSTPALVTLAEEAASDLGSSEIFVGLPESVEDDHLPYRLAGVKALDLIDFSHLAYWHKAGDEPGTISFESIDLAAKIALYVAVATATEPKVLLQSTDQ